MVFVFDACASGLAFTPKSDTPKANEETLSTLSGNGSRVVITAGTGNEEAFGATATEGTAHSLFTSALVDVIAGLFTIQSAPVTSAG